MAENRKRDKTLTVRMTDDELAAFRRELSASGAKCQTDFVLMLLRKSPVVVINELMTCMVELKRQGNNLNQIARALHEGTATEQGVRQVMRECHAAYKKLLDTKLGGGDV